MIEYKQSFAGGKDYLAFSDALRAKAIENIARGAVAFLNGRGGDIVVGVREAANDHPTIEELTPIANVDQTVERLAQSLAAQIEPTQSVLGLKAIRQAEGDSEGVIVIRCPSSLRAPHRFMHRFYEIERTLIGKYDSDVVTGDWLNADAEAFQNARKKQVKTYSAAWRRILRRGRQNGSN